jgi:hypothetical protein
MVITLDVNTKLVKTPIQKDFYFPRKVSFFCLFLWHFLELLLRTCLKYNAMIRIVKKMAQTVVYDQ